MRGTLGGAISAFELMHVQGLAFLGEVLPQIPVPPAMPGNWVVLAEAADAAGAEVGARLESSLAAAEALIAQSDAQRAAFWRVREAIPEANRRIGAVSSHDIALPPGRIAEFVARAGPAIASIDPELRVNCFGHLGDGNLHYNVFPPRGHTRDEYDSRREAVKLAVHDLTHALGGSVGAEHGVGRLKAGDLVRYGDPGKLAAMRAIKAALDPQGILNPGAVLA
jgi:FAD/FMN-containing dehydrogenase